MSTRAIIGYRLPDGKFAAGWQWNDGMGLAPLLRRQFDTIEKVDALISNGVWNNIVAPRDKETLSRFREWTKRPNSAYYLVEAGKCHLLKERPCDSAEFCFEGDEGVEIRDSKIIFESFEFAMWQDINYLYEFIPETGKWVVHK